METVWIVLVGSFIVVVLAISGYFAYGQIKTRQLEDEVLLWIESHRGRLTGENRFILNEGILQLTFTEYPRDVIMAVWIKLIRDKVVIRDPMDNEWCIR